MRQAANNRNTVVNAIRLSCHFFSCNFEKVYRLVIIKPRENNQPCNAFLLKVSSM